MHRKRTTPEVVLSLEVGEIFVFGSNEAGRHGKGAALTALKKFGAIYGCANGIQGQSYGIPTVNSSIRNTLSLEQISTYVNEFIEYAKKHSEYTFLVTEIGCGLAGLKTEDVGPLFKEAVNVENIHLPKRFWNVLLGEYQNE